MFILSGFSLFNILEKMWLLSKVSREEFKNQEKIDRDRKFLSCLIEDSSLAA